MRTKLGLLLLLVAAALVHANENPQQAPPAGESNSKVLIIDNSRLLTKEEVDRLADKDSIPVAVPVADPSNKIKPKIGTVVEPESDVKLPPMPLIMPPFLHNIFDQPEIDPVPADAAQPDASKPKGIVSVLLIKSHRVEEPGQEGSAPQPEGVKSSFVIMRYLPSWFSGGSIDSNEPNILGGGDDDPDKKRDSGSAHLFGGDDDIDHKRMHLLGGGDDDVDKKRVNLLGGEGDPDRLVRLDLDDSNKGVFTGGNDEVFSNNVDQHRVFVFSMFDRLRSMFENMRSTFEQQLSAPGSDAEAGEPSNLESMPFISIRTDDGQSALIPNDIGYAEKQQHEQSLNKCMMLQFMRLKASMYYRTILHLLFFTGVLLFILSLVMLLVRACRRRQLARRHHRHHHHHHPNMAISSIEAGKSKLAAYKAWQGLDQSSLIEPSDKIVLIQAPPAYDQVFIHDKNSTLTSARKSFSCQDECETKSLPPDYEEKPAQP